MKLLKPEPSDLRIQFRTAAEKLKIIDDANQCTILVPYGEGEKWINFLKKDEIPRLKCLRKLQRYTINVYKEQFNKLNSRGSLEEITLGIFALNNSVEYNDQTGLLIDETLNDPEDFIC